MKNLLTLSAILLVSISLSVNAASKYDQTLRSPDYQRALESLERIKSDNEGLNGLIRLIGSNNTLRVFALHRLVALRCDRYLPRSEAKSCGETVLKMLRILDFDIRFLESPAKNIPPFVFVAFETSLIQLLNQETTGQYLQLMAQKFEAQSYSPIRLFNLWEETLAFYGGNEGQAVGVMAMLFQDTSAAQIHLEYLARRRVEGSRFFDPNVSRLARVIELMARLQEEQQTLYNELAYPPGTGSRFNNNIYHYYVPWFLAATLRAQGSQARAAGIAPLMLSATYEFITSGDDYSYLFFDPKLLTSTWTMRDIFAGTSGAHRGSNTVKPAPELAEVQRLFQQSSKSAMMELLKAF